MTMPLKKELSLLTATLYGVGIILGAGIYVLIGQGAAIAGDALWMSFVVAALIAFFTGMSYAELAGMFPKTAAEYVYTNRAFRKNWLSFLVQWVMMFSLIISATVVALGFGNYFSAMFSGSAVLTAALLIAGLSAISYIGIKESVRISAISALIEMGGLLLVIAVSAPYIGNPAVNYFEVPSVLSIFSATALIFFAYIGFEGLANMTEDTRNASKVMPKALLLSILITTILYVLVSIAAVSIAGSGVLASSSAPLADVTELALPGSSWLLSVIALIATGSTVLALLIIGSRMFYGMARNHSMPAVLGKTGKRKTPYVAIAAVMVLSIIPLLFGGLGTLALLTDMGIFIVYFFVNASVIALRYKMPRAKRSFRSPINIGKFPVLALLGITTSLLMLLHFDAAIVYYQLAAILAGFAVYIIFRKARNMHKERYARFFRKPVILMRSIVKNGTRYMRDAPV